MAIDPRICKKYPFVESVGLYGSCAKGDNREDSEIDLWVKIKEASEENQAVLISELRKKIKNVKTLLLTEEKLEKIKEDHVFYNSLFFGSITVYGDENGL